MSTPSMFDLIPTDEAAEPITGNPSIFKCGICGILFNGEFPTDKAALQLLGVCEGPCRGDWLAKANHGWFAYIYYPDKGIDFRSHYPELAQATATDNINHPALFGQATPTGRGAR